MPTIPKRPSQKLGHISTKTDPSNNARVGKSAGKPVIPNPDPEWHPVAQGMYKAARMSGMAQWYETSDWAMAWVACETLDRLYKFGFTAGLLHEFNDMAGALLWTEGSRRTARIELIRAGGDVDEDESEMSLKELRAAMRDGTIEGKIKLCLR